MDGHKIPLHENTCCSHISSAHVTVTLLSRIVSLMFKESRNFMFLFLLGGWEGGGTGLPSSMYTKFFFLKQEEYYTTSECQVTLETTHGFKSRKKKLWARSPIRYTTPQWLTLSSPVRL